MKTVLIKNGHLVDPKNKINGNFDILIEGDKVKEIALSIKATADEIIDAKGCIVAPGFIDLHVHLREPGFEWKETVRSGCTAAVLGGYTTICSMPNTNPVNDSRETTEYILSRAKEAGLARVLPIGSVSIGLKGKEMSPLSELREAGCCAFSDDGEPVWDSGLMVKALQWSNMVGAVISCHEEDKNLSAGGVMNESALAANMGLKGFPGVAEDVMVARDIELSLYTKAPAHICHVSTARSLELIRRAKKDGIKITCEVTPHHLTLTEDAVKDYNTHAKMSPPLRTKKDIDALIIGLQDGTIDAIASDHAPHEPDRKEIEFAKAAFGILGLQTSLPLILEFVEKGVITLDRAIEVCTAGPARCFNLPYGHLGIGATADIVVIDPKAEWEFTKDLNKSKSRNSPFFGRKLTGKARDVLVAGKVVVQNGEI